MANRQSACLAGTALGKTYSTLQESCAPSCTPNQAELTCPEHHPKCESQFASMLLAGGGGNFGRQSTQLDRRQQVTIPQLSRCNAHSIQPVIPKHQQAMPKSHADSKCQLHTVKGPQHKQTQESMVMMFQTKREAHNKAHGMDSSEWPSAACYKLVMLIQSTCIRQCLLALTGGPTTITPVTAITHTMATQDCCAAHALATNIPTDTNAGTV